MAKNIAYQFSANHLSLDSIDLFYKRSLASIECRYSKNSNHNYSMDFLDMTEEEIALEAQNLIDELQKETMFHLLASIEALLRIDFIVRIDKKDKQPISCYFRNNYNMFEKQKKRNSKTLDYKKNESDAKWRVADKYRVDLCDDILKGWREFYPENKKCINLLSDAFNYRNWLAHGRYRLFEDENKYSFFLISNIVAVFKETIMPLLLHF